MGFHYTSHFYNQVKNTTFTKKNCQPYLNLNTNSLVLSTELFEDKLWANCFCLVYVHVFNRFKLQNLFSTFFILFPPINRILERLLIFFWFADSIISGCSWFFVLCDNNIFVSKIFFFTDILWLNFGLFAISRSTFDVIFTNCYLNTYESFQYFNSSHLSDIWDSTVILCPIFIFSGLTNYGFVDIVNHQHYSSISDSSFCYTYSQHFNLLIAFSVFLSII